MYNWKETFEWGVNEEHRVLKALAERKPNLNIHPLGGKDEPDGWSDVGGIEIKSYSTWYYYPSIETKCMNSGKPSCWVSDDRYRLLVVNHEGWLHLYSVQRLRYNLEEANFPFYYSNVSQGNGSYKKMKFIRIHEVSTLNVKHTEKEKDYLRWDCSKLSNNPYIGSYYIKE